MSSTESERQKCDSEFNKDWGKDSLTVGGKSRLDIEDFNYTRG